MCAALERLEYEKKIATGLLTTVEAGRLLNISQQAVSRHMLNHLSKRLEKRIVAKMEKEDDSIVGALKKSRAKILEICDAALADGDYNAAIRALSTEVQQLALQGKVTNAYSDQSQVNVLVHSDNDDRVMAVILQVLEPYPDIKLVLSEALDKLVADEDA